MQHLASPAGSVMLAELRIAKAWQVRPTRLRAEWSARDIALAHALLEVESSVGPCGHPHLWSTDPANDLDGWVEVQTIAHCPFCESLDLWRRDNEESDRDPGDVLGLVNTKPLTRGA